MSNCGDAEHIVLVGMMGAGKSSVGRELARQLDRPLLDTDTLVEHRAGRPVREIWAEQGESAFREIEREVVTEVLGSREPSVIAAAGGIVLDARNRDALTRSDAHVVWLLADVEVLLERVRNGPHRPALDDDPDATLHEMFKVRAPLYREVADAIVSVEHRSVGDVAHAVMRCCG